MRRAFELLSKQPTAFPKWELGRRHNGSYTEDLHLFVFENHEFDLDDYAIPVCRFVEGAEWIGRTAQRSVAGAIPHCTHCVEVSVQFWLHNESV